MSHSTEKVISQVKTSETNILYEIHNVEEMVAQLSSRLDTAGQKNTIPTDSLTSLNKALEQLIKASKKKQEGEKLRTFCPCCRLSGVEFIPNPKTAGFSCSCCGYILSKEEVSSPVTSPANIIELTAKMDCDDYGEPMAKIVYSSEADRKAAKKWTPGCRVRLSFDQSTVGILDTPSPLELSPRVQINPKELILTSNGKYNITSRTVYKLRLAFPYLETIIQGSGVCYTEGKKPDGWAIDGNRIYCTV